ncbi:type IX secretion system plug protein [Pinibacter aurantiacus]|uniref:DUF5103 domain-containing protein n=1 Tax=Pinibacter aurantiacus TaxID=2851599 RepID=A0A9E2SC53_9BACT|nr:DUF5103 domain-containing protein [Pinibacter aurantiacus]MBV4358612.1 DUF5103 domain-containing protein [Pinibacter aurantiacus]
MKKLILLFAIVCGIVDCGLAQPEYTYVDNIKNIKLYPYGNQIGYPILGLNSGDKMELHFDDLDGGVADYSYTYQLCNADWTPAILGQLDYIRGFVSNRLLTYRNSSVSLTKYTHYQAVLPENNSSLSRSGNYILKVYANGDTSQLLFTRRFLVVDPKAAAIAQIQQPFNGQYFTTHQKIQMTVNTKTLDLVNPMQQIKVCILQNYRWDNAICNIKPTFIRKNELAYNTEEDCIFPGGREWRWLDLRSFRLQSDRVTHADYRKDGTDIYVKTDLDREKQPFLYYQDNNGRYYNDVTESVNYLWQADYAKVNFSFRTPDGHPFDGRDLYLFGELTNYGLDPEAKMIYNADKGLYETSLFLKQAYYDYSYITVDKAKPRSDFSHTEGNYWETENSYTILVYYRSLSDRADELVDVTQVNSITGRQGYSN